MNGRGGGSDEKGENGGQGKKFFFFFFVFSFEYLHVSQNAGIIDCDRGVVVLFSNFISFFVSARKMN